MARRLGLRFDENMYGTYRRLGESRDQRRFAFHLEAHSESLLRTLRDGRVATARWGGAEGLAAHAALRGSMVIRPLLSRFIRYDFEFKADDGAAYRYSGSKTIRHLHPKRTWTTLPGSIYDCEDREIATSVTHFDLAELRAFMASFKTTLEPGSARVAHT